MWKYALNELNRSGFPHGQSLHHRAGRSADDIAGADVSARWQTKLMKVPVLGRLPVALGGITGLLVKARVPGDSWVVSSAGRRDSHNPSYDHSRWRTQQQLAV